MTSCATVKVKSETTVSLTMAGDVAERVKALLFNAVNFAECPWALDTSTTPSMRQASTPLDELDDELEQLGAGPTSWLR